MSPVPSFYGGVPSTYRGVAYNNRPTTTKDQCSTKTNIQEQARYQILRKEKADHSKS